MKTKQNINLYNFGSGSKESIFAKLNVFYYVDAIFIIILFSIYAYKTLQFYLVSTRYNDLLEEAKELDISLSQKEKTVSQLMASDEDKKYLESQKLTVQQREKLLHFLRNSQNPLKFSLFMKDLQASYQPGMQIQLIDIKNYGRFIDFGGLTVSSEVVSQWLHRLKSQTSYEKSEFEAISMERDINSSFLIFEVKSLYE